VHHQGDEHGTKADEPGWMACPERFLPGKWKDGVNAMGDPKTESAVIGRTVISPAMSACAGFLAGCCG
jgi:hypothetical protein